MDYFRGLSRQATNLFTKKSTTKTTISTTTSPPLPPPQVLTSLAATSLATTSLAGTPATATTGPVALFLEEVQQVLANASVGDSRHDFHIKISGIAQFLRDNKDKYNDSLPTGFSDIVIESNILSSVVAGQNDYSPIIEHITNQSNTSLTPKKSIYEFPYTTRDITTITNKDYTVRRVQVKELLAIRPAVLPGRPPVKTWSDEYIGARKFTHELDIPSHSAFVIDAAAISFNTIMCKDEITNDPARAVNASEHQQNQYYYIFASELENDPAGKTCVDDPIFNRGPNPSGHILISCVSSSDDLNANYYYNWVNGSNSPYNQLFTNYNLQLSELQSIKKGKSISYSTNIQITDPTHQYDSDPIMDSGTANKISALSSSIQSIMNFFKKTGKISEEKARERGFTMNVNFLQKRSGDWLQVLLCLLIRLRNFKIFNSTEDNVQTSFSEIYFVTHDRIALAFALLLGVNVIFTHGDTQSAYSFKLSNQEDKTTRINNRLLDISTKFNDLKILHAKCMEYMDNYKTTIYDPLIPSQFLIESECNKINGLSVDNEFASTIVTNATRSIFRLAYQRCYLKLIFPDISKWSIFKDINIDDSIIANFPIDTADETIKQDYINKFNQMMIELQNIVNTLMLYIDDNGNMTISIAETITFMKKQPSYKATEWTWDISTTARYYQRLKSIVLTTNYRNDKHVFLYNLNNLDEDIKIAITQTYAHLYTILNDVQGVSLNQSTVGKKTKIDLQKFVNVVQSFCVEVLLNLGNPTPASINVDNIIQTFLKKPIPTDHGTTTSTTSSSMASTISPPQQLHPYNANINYYPIIEETNIVDENNTIILNPLIIISGTAITSDNKSNEDIELPSVDVDELDENLESKGGGVVTINRRVFPRVIIDQHPKSAIRPLLTMQISYNTVSRDSLRMSSAELHQQINDIYIEQAIFEQTDENYIIPAAEGATSASGKAVVSLAAISAASTAAEKNLDLPNYDDNITNIEHLTTNIEGSRIDRSQMEQNNGSISSGKASGKAPSNKKGGMVENVDDSDEIPLKSITLVEDSTKPIDILTNNSICFYPTLPVYMILDSYLSLLDNDQINESLDYDFCIKYLNFLIKLEERLNTSFSNENNIVDNQIKAYIIGSGLKELLFTSNVDDIGHNKCMISLEMTPDEYLPISSMSSTLSYMMSGRIRQTEEEKRIGIRILESPIFTDYIKTINVKAIFNEPISDTKEKSYPTIEELYQTAKLFLLNTGNRIISRRRGQIEPPILITAEDIKIFQLPITAYYDNLDIGTTIVTDSTLKTPMTLSPIPSTSPYLNQEDIIRMKEKAEKATQLYTPQQSIKPRAMTLSDLPPPTPEELKKYQEQTNMEVSSNNKQQSRRPSSAPWGGKITRRYKKLSNNQNKRSNRKKRSNRNKKSGKYRTRRIHKKSKHIKKNTRRNRK